MDSVIVIKVRWHQSKAPAGWHYGTLVALDNMTAHVRNFKGVIKKVPSDTLEVIINGKNTKFEVDKFLNGTYTGKCVGQTDQLITDKEIAAMEHKNHQHTQEAQTVSEPQEAVATTNEAVQEPATEVEVSAPATEAPAPAPAAEKPAKKEKSNSLKELGYKLETVEGLADSKGNPFPYKATSPRGTEYLIKKTKSGLLRAFRTVDAKDTITVSNLYAFSPVLNQETGALEDLIGEPLKVGKVEAIAQPATDQPQAA